MKRILCVFGTRPEAIKMCPLIGELRRREGVSVPVAVSGQHREMLDQVLSVFEILPDYDLRLMREGQSLSSLTARAIAGFDRVFADALPDTVLVHGDTTTAFSAALAAFYRKIPICHVEAGLRTRDLFHPFPEEYNRRAISLLASYHFAPTVMARDNLLTEGKEKHRIFVSGNTGIDALRVTVRESFSHPLLTWAKGSRLLLLTAHRRENLGEPMRRVFKAVRRLVEDSPDVRVIYPCHKNPQVASVAREIFAGCERIRLCEPLDVVTFHNLLSRCYFVLSDSGGIQEEATALGKPVLVLRDTTERPEGVAFGSLKTVGCDGASLYQSARLLLEDATVYASMARASDLYGNGYASKKIADILLSL